MAVILGTTLMVIGMVSAIAKMIIIRRVKVYNMLTRILHYVGLFMTLIGAVVLSAASRPLDTWMWALVWAGLLVVMASWYDKILFLQDGVD